MLRSVTPSSVTVWLALQIGATVTLTVRDDRDNEVMKASRATVGVGSYLHLIAVTAIAASPGPLQEGIIYTYDLAFDFNDQVSFDLDLATRSAPLVYPPFARPSFCLPSSNLNTLRLLQGSCRIPHGNGKDAMDLADFLIAQWAADPARRPKQMSLTGDQIYADDVAPCRARKRPPVSRFSTINQCRPTANDSGCGAAAGRFVVDGLVAATGAAGNTRSGENPRRRS